MTVVAIVQARMTSTRLAGKVLADIDGAPMLARVVERVSAAGLVSRVWVACTDLGTDDPIVECCRGLEVPVFRGSEADVLGRYVGAATAAGAEVVVRVTADCPLLDPEVIDRVVAALAPGIDYASNVLERSFPRGLDVEAFRATALARMDQLARSTAAREHVTIGVRLEHPDLFTTANVRSPTDDSDLRWTVDTPRMARTKPGNPAPLPISTRQSTRGGRCARNWAESSIWRRQRSSRLPDATRLRVFCHLARVAA